MQTLPLNCGIHAAMSVYQVGVMPFSTVLVLIVLLSSDIHNNPSPHAAEKSESVMKDEVCGGLRGIYKTKKKEKGK